MKVVDTISTKVTKGGAAKNTVLTIDFTGATQEQIAAYAAQAIKVRCQGKWRQDGIPGEFTFKVTDHPVGVRMPAKPTVESLHAHANTMSREEKLALIAKLMADSKGRELEDAASEDAE